MSVGADVPRIDGVDKLTGVARYVDDIELPGMLYGAAVRSPVARGRIRRIRFDEAFDFSDFVVLDARDLPGPNEIAMIENDWRALAEHEVRHVGEPILLLAHRDRRRLQAARRAVHVEIEPLPAVDDILAPLRPELIQYGSDNVFKRIEISKGDVAAAFGGAARVIEGTYHTGAQEHVYIEPQGVIASHEDGRLVVRGSLQCPYYVLSALTHLLGRTPDQVRVVQTVTGGGFGGKEDYPSLLAAHAALLAEKARAPVKMVYQRAEDMAVTTKRHPSIVRHRTAVAADGRLLALEIELLLDAGAYVTLSPVVLSRACIHAAGPYHCEHVRIYGEARLSNKPPFGAFRGFGAPQAFFALERHMDVIADELGIDPVELRRRNLLRAGQQMATGQVVRDEPDLVALLDKAVAESGYHEKRRAAEEFNRSHPYLRRGVGLACFQHGAGFTGAGESYLASEVAVAGLPEGAVEVRTAQTDMGQGAVTVLTQIVADRLGLPVEQVHMAVPDTARVPDSGPTVASRTVMIVGKLLERACDQLRARLPAGLPPAEAIRAWHAAHPGGELCGRARYEKPPEIEWDERTYRGDAYATYAWAVYVAEVEVDLRTYQPRVRDFVAVQDIGRVVNPTLARGQVQGGVVQAIGWALSEEVVWEAGAMLNCHLTDYIIPTAADVPPIRVIFAEHPTAYGPRGAKGLGELPHDGPAPAVLNAVCRAVGRRIDRIPLTPERLLEYIEDHGDG